VHASLLYLKELAERARSGFGSTDNTNLDAVGGGDGGRGNVLGLHAGGGMLPVVRELLAFNHYDGGGRGDMDLRAIIYGENSSVNEFKQPTDTAVEDGSRGGISQGGGSGGDQPLLYLPPYPSSSERLSSVDVIRSYFPTSNTTFAGLSEAENTSYSLLSHDQTFPEGSNSDVIRLTSMSSHQGMADIHPPSLGRQPTTDILPDLMFNLLDVETVRKYFAVQY